MFVKWDDDLIVQGRSERALPRMGAVIIRYQRLTLVGRRLFRLRGNWGDGLRSLLSHFLIFWMESGDLVLNQMRGK